MDLVIEMMKNLRSQIIVNICIKSGVLLAVLYFFFPTVSKDIVYQHIALFQYNKDIFIITSAPLLNVFSWSLAVVFVVYFYQMLKLLFHKFNNLSRARALIDFCSRMSKIQAETRRKINNSGLLDEGVRRQLDEVDKMIEGVLSNADEVIAMVANEVNTELINGRGMGDRLYAMTLIISLVSFLSYTDIRTIEVSQDWLMLAITLLPIGVVIIARFILNREFIQAREKNTTLLRQCYNFIAKCLARLKVERGIKSE